MTQKHYPSEIQPFLPYLLQDIWEIGSPPEIIEAAVRKHVPKPRAISALDLACGKGAVTITLAKKLGLKSKGIDILPEFVEQARQKAIEKGAHRSLTFAQGDPNKAAELERGWDIVIYAPAENLMGKPQQIIEKLAPVVCKQGYLVLGGRYNDSPDVPQKLKEKCISPGRWKEIFRQNGFCLLEEYVVDTAVYKQKSDADVKAVMQRAAELCIKYPEKTEVINNFAECYLSKTADSEQNIVNAIWMLQKQ